MKLPNSFLYGLLAACMGFSGLANAQEAPAVPVTSLAQPSALTAPMFYELLLAELKTMQGDPAAGYAIVLNNARRQRSEQLYQRAVTMALAWQSGDAALQAARAWVQDFPTSPKANDFVLQILVALNRIEETRDPLRIKLANSALPERPATLILVAKQYAQVTDKALALRVIEQTLKPYAVGNSEVAAAAWTTIARARWAAQDKPGAMQALQLAQAADAQADEPIYLALDLMSEEMPEAEAVVLNYLKGPALPPLWLGYVRELIEQQRYTEALTQVRSLTAAHADFASSWLVLGALQAQEGGWEEAPVALQRYIELAQKTAKEEEYQAGLNQAYLMLSQLAERKGDMDAAQSWVDKVQNPSDPYPVQVRRASLLMKKGEVSQALELINKLPERNDKAARTKILLQVQLLRDYKYDATAYDLLVRTTAQPKYAGEVELLYEQANSAERLRRYEEMEQVLRKIIVLKPDFYAAYNALGYSMADRGVNLPQARELIQKALEHAPQDPAIIDSMGWVEFRLGNKTEALRLLKSALAIRPDVEIAMHLGEVLWSMGQKEEARRVWREAQALPGDQDALQATLRRLGAKL